MRQALQNFLNSDWLRRTKEVLIASGFGFICFLALLAHLFPCQFTDLNAQAGIDDAALAINWLFFISLLLWPYLWSVSPRSDASSDRDFYRSLLKNLVRLAALGFGIFSLQIIGLMFSALDPRLTNAALAALALILFPVYFYFRVAPAARRRAILLVGASLLVPLVMIITEKGTINPDNFNSSLSDLEAVVSLVESGKLEVDNYNFASLPCQYNWLASRGYKFRRGRIMVNRSSEGLKIVFPQRSYGLFGDNSDYLFYQSNGNNIASQTGTLTVRKLKDKWFWQESRS